MKIKLLGVALDTEIERMTNPDVAERYEKCIEKGFERIERTKDKAGSEGLREQCQAVIDMLTEMFGAKDAEKVLGAETNVFRCMDALDDFANLYNDQITPMLEKRVEKYGRARLNGR